MGVQNSIIGFICCCGALEDAFDDSNYERVVDNQGLHEPLVSTAENGFLAEDDPPQKKKELKLNNILGFGMRDVHKDYEIGELLGEGAFGVVTRCRNRATGEVFACKKIEKRQMKRKADVEDIRREVQILMLLSSHPSVAALCKVYEDDEAVYLILELCDGGQIFDRFIDMGSVTEHYISRVFRQMVELVHHCHTLGIAHRDIKPENFLFSSKEKNAKVKAADFGLSQFFMTGKNFKSVVGSEYYVAPEVLNRNYGPKADVWSLGVCLYVMLAGYPPFDEKDGGSTFDKILYSEPDLSATPWPSISKPAKDLIKQLLQKNPDKRPETQYILRHRWLNEAAPHHPLDPTVLQNLRRFASNTRVHREAMFTSRQAMEAGATTEMCDLVVQEVKNTGHVLSCEDVGALMAKNNMTVSTKVKEHLSKFSEAKIRALSSEECISAALDRSETKRDEFLQMLYRHFDARLPFQRFEKVVSVLGKSDAANHTSVPASDIDTINCWMDKNKRAIKEISGFKIPSSQGQNA